MGQGCRLTCQCSTETRDGSHLNNTPCHDSIQRRIMKPRTALQRRERQIRRAVHGVKRGVSYRVAEKRFRIAKSTIWDRVNIERNPSRAGRTALKKEEEKQIVELLVRFSDRGVPLTRVHLIEAAEIIIDSFDASRKSKLPFRNGRPGVRWARSFYKRHNKQLKFVMPNKQESRRHRAINADYLTSHFATIQALVDEYGITDEYIWNLDETGFSPGKDLRGITQKRRFSRRDNNVQSNVVVAEFKNCHRFTMMPCISASGDIGPTLFLFKGIRLPYREVNVGPNRVVETPLHKLPRNSLLYFREDIAGVNTECFYKWALEFTKHVDHLTSGGRKILLTYDSYRSHMSLKVLEHFKTSNVLVYALPAHTSGKTQPLDVVTFGSMKQSLDELISNAIEIETLEAFDIYQLCTLVKKAFTKAFTRQEIMSAFERSGLWPVNHQKILGVPRRANDASSTRLLSVDEIEKLFLEKRAMARRRLLGSDVSIGTCGFVDTAKGALLNCDAALNAVRVQDESRKARREDAERRAKIRVQAREKRQQEALVKERTKDRAERAWIERAEKARWAERARLANRSIDAFREAVRPLPVRREIARARAGIRQAECEAKLLLGLASEG